MSHVLPQLTFDFTDLSPWIDAVCLKFHYEVIHQDHVRFLNEALSPFPRWGIVSIEELVNAIDSVPPEIQQAVRYHGGGHANHILFWLSLGPERRTGPTGALAGAISTTFGGLSEFQRRFTETALKHNGDGWAWLSVNRYGNLEVESTKDEENPLMYGHKPILGLDLWRHAYCDQYKNCRADYIAAWWHVVNWPNVERFFAGRRWFADPGAVTP